MVLEYLITSLLTFGAVRLYDWMTTPPEEEKKEGEESNDISSIIEQALASKLDPIQGEMTALKDMLKEVKQTQDDSLENEQSVNVDELKQHIEEKVSPYTSIEEDIKAIKEYLIPEEPKQEKTQTQSNAPKPRQY